MINNFFLKFFFHIDTWLEFTSYRLLSGWCVILIQPTSTILDWAHLFLEWVVIFGLQFTCLCIALIDRHRSPTTVLSLFSSPVRVHLPKPDTANLLEVNHAISSDWRHRRWARPASSGFRAQFLSLPCYWVHFNQGSALSFESLRRACA